MRRRTTATLVALLSTTAAVVSALPAHAAVSPRASFSAMTIEAVPGSRILESGRQEVVDPAVTVRSDPDTIVFSNPSSSYMVSLSTTPGGALLQPGASYRTDAFGAAVEVRMSTPTGPSCTQSGTLDVHDVQYEPGTRVISSLAASYSEHCDSQTQSVVGELRYDSTVDYVVDGVAALGTPTAPQTVTVTASSATTYGTATLEGPDAGDWTVTQNSCSGTSSDAGSTCAVTVVARPTAQSGERASLRLPSTGDGDRITSLTAVGVDTAAGAYQALPPVRLLDTRTGLGARGPVAGGTDVAVRIAGRGGVAPTGVSAVVLNVTVTRPTMAGFVTLYPSGAIRPATSSVNFPAGWTGANLVTVPVGADGSVRIYNATGTTHVIADVVGFYHSASSTADPTAAHLGDFVSPTTPYRLFDTRRDWGQPLVPDYDLVVGANYGDFGQRIRAFAANITVVGGDSAGYVTTWDGGPSRPGTSTLNYGRRQVVANMAVIPAGRCGDTCGAPGASYPSIGVRVTSGAPAHVIVDIVGVYFDGVEGDRGWRYRSLSSPTRIADTRRGLGLPTPIGQNASQSLVVPPSVAGYNTMAVVSNVTAVWPTKGTFLTLWRNDGSRLPDVSNLNAGAGQIVANMAVTEVWTRNDVRVYNSQGTTQFLMDATGTMELYPALVPPGGVAAGAHPLAEASKVAGGSAGATPRTSVAPPPHRR